MATRVGINGFGRIGRQVHRAILERHPDGLDVAAINDLADAKTNAHLFKYDTNYGAFQGSVEARNGSLVVNGNEVRVFSERDPAPDTLGRAWDRPGDRVHRHLHRCQEGVGPPGGWRQEGHHLGAGQE